MKVYITLADGEFDPPAVEDEGTFRLRTLLDSVAEKRRKGESSREFEDEICREFGMDGKLPRVMAQLRMASKRLRAR